MRLGKSIALLLRSHERPVSHDEIPGGRRSVRQAICGGSRSSDLDGVLVPLALAFGHRHGLELLTMPDPALTASAIVG